MSSRRKSRAPWLAIVGVPVLFILIAMLQAKIDASARSYADESEDLLLQSGRGVQRMSLGYDSLVADIYWTRAVQYYGARAGVDGAQFGLLWPLLDIATTLRTPSSSSPTASARMLSFRAPPRRRRPQRPCNSAREKGHGRESGQLVSGR